MAGGRVYNVLQWCGNCRRLPRCFRGDAISDDETQSVNMSQFQIPPRRRSNYQGFDEVSEDGSFRSRSASTTSSTQIQPELYDDILEDSDDFTLYGPPSLEDRVKREEVGASYGTLVLTAKVGDDKKVSLRLCDLRGLPGKGMARSRTYWVAVQATVRRCTKKCRAVRVNEREATTRLNEELRFLGSAGDSLQIAVFEDGDKERPLGQTDVLGYCQIALAKAIEGSSEGRNAPNDASVHTCRLTQSLVTAPMGELLLSLNYENSNLLTVAVVKTKGLTESTIKVTLRCNGEKIKKGHVKGCGPIYNQSFKFILPEQFISASSVFIAVTPRSRKLRRNGNNIACCISGPWMVYSDGRLSHWGEMLILKKPILQWRLLYPV